VIHVSELEKFVEEPKLLDRPRKWGEGRGKYVGIKRAARGPNIKVSVFKVGAHSEEKS
jgi:hypothetical protein